MTSFLYGHCVALLLLLSHLMGGVDAAPCRMCHGNFPSCRFAEDGTPCPTTGLVEANRAVMAAGTGTIRMVGLVKNRFLKMFSSTTFEALVNLVNRPEPGAPFVIDVNTKGTAILTAISNGQVTLEFANWRIQELIDEVDVGADNAQGILSKLRGKLDGLKVRANNDKAVACMPSASSVDMGIFSYLWGKVSEYVMTKNMHVKMMLDSAMAVGLQVNSVSSSSSALGATIHRPEKMEDFSEMMNLFTMMCTALAVASALVITDFFEHAVYDTIRLHNRTWKLAHELMLILFRAVEDSGGKLTLGTCYDEKYLNTTMMEAQVNEAMFFRTRGGKPAGGGAKDDDKRSTESDVTYNGKFASGTNKACKVFNKKDGKHIPNMLFNDGRCKFNHVCTHWVSNKGKHGRCMGAAGTPGHAAFDCDNPNKCDEPVA
jgi:hypothetical protein